MKSINYKRNLVLLAFSLLYTIGYSQIVWIEKPQNLQLYPIKNIGDSGVIRFNGYFINDCPCTIRLGVYRNNVLQYTLDYLKTPVNDTVWIDTIIKIPAELAVYKFTSRLNGYEPTRITEADSVVAGIVFFANGQSNMVMGGGSQYSSNYIRSFGYNSRDNIYDVSRDGWYYANENSYNVNGGVGYSGMKICGEIVKNHKCPCAFINNAVGGTSITAHARGINPFNLNTIYGRSYYRLYKSGVLGKVKDILWLQGEQNQNLGYSFAWRDSLSNLIKNWRSDTIGFDTVYVGQITLGCSTTDSASSFREMQRQLPNYIDSISMFTTIGTPVLTSDLCHYTTVGKDSLWNRVYKQIAQNTFDSVFSYSIKYPNVDTVYYLSSNKDTIAIKFDEAIQLPQVISGRNVKDYFFDENFTRITTATSSFVQDSTYYLVGTFTAKRLTYLPSNYLNGYLYQTPVITSINGFPAFSFSGKYIYEP